MPKGPGGRVSSGGIGRPVDRSRSGLTEVWGTRKRFLQQKKPWPEKLAKGLCEIRAGMFRAQVSEGDSDDNRESRAIE